MKPFKSVNVTLIQTLSKDVYINVDDYIELPDGKIDTAWKEFVDHRSPAYLISLFRMYLKNGAIKEEFIDEDFKNYLISECSNWVEDDYQVLPNYD